VTTLAEQLRGWTPIRVYWRDGRALVDWCHMDGLGFAEPLFDQTAERAMRRPFNLLFRRQTPLDALGELYEQRPGLRPAGLIFHMSRCGSTLVSQMLAALPHAVVLSEAGPVDSVIRADDSDPEACAHTRATWLRWAVGALGQPRRAGDRHLFVKLDAWHALDLAVVRRAFPGVPAVFLYRDPVEVMVSQLRREPSWMLTGALEPRLLGIDPAEVFRMTRADYCARVLARICGAALADGRLRLVNYSQLPGAVWSVLPGLFGVELTGGDVELMRRAASFDAKSPGVRFAPDAEQKRREADEEIRRAAERWLRPIFDALESARLAQESACPAAACEDYSGRAAAEGRP
jgi:hypothetical protein